MKTIQCSTTRDVVLVDDEDYDALKGYLWRAQRETSGDAHARRSTLLADGPGHGKGIFMHRQVLGYPDRALSVDHINGNGLDNRKENLRLVPHKANTRNTTRKKHGVGIPGVDFDSRTGKWFARIARTDTTRRDFHLGSYADFASAAVIRSYAQSLDNTRLEAQFPMGSWSPKRVNRSPEEARAVRARWAREWRAKNPEAAARVTARYRAKKGLP